MWQLATAFGEIALRRRGPDGVPDSSFLVLLLVVVYLLVSIVSFSVDGTLSRSNLLLLALDTPLALAFTFSVLAFFKLERRFRQTVTAILGADIVITVIYLPISLVGRGLGLELSQLPFAWVQIAFIAWSVFIAASILARSLSQPLIVGFMFEILYFFVSITLFQMLIVDPELTTQTVG